MSADRTIAKRPALLPKKKLVVIAAISRKETGAWKYKAPNTARAKISIVSVETLVGVKVLSVLPIRKMRLWPAKNSIHAAGVNAPTTIKLDQTLGDRFWRSIKSLADQ